MAMHCCIVIHLESPPFKGTMASYKLQINLITCNFKSEFELENNALMLTVDICNI